MIYVVGHRGIAGRAPENTRAGFRLAWELGVDMVELDVHLTADGHPVVIHDAEIDRTTNGVGRVAELTLAEIQLLDAGIWFGPAFAGEGVPTLIQVLAEGRSRAASRGNAPGSGVRASSSLDQRSSSDGIVDGPQWLVELKKDASPPERLVERVLASIDEAGAAAAVRLISFQEELLAEARRQAPAIPRGLIARDNPAALLAAAKRQLCVAIHPIGYLLTADLIAAAHASGQVVNTWVINRSEQVRLVARLGVDEITSDLPDVVLAELRQPDFQE